MCLILFSYDTHPEYKLIFAANRDEFYDRPTKALAFWNDSPDILAGRDLKSQGTWLGISLTGRIAAITNFRDPLSIVENAPSRGLLIRNFLAGSQSSKQYLEHIKTSRIKYNGFNLLVGDSTGLYYYSNKDGSIKKILPGLYGLSNDFIDTPWPKVQKGKARLKALLKNENEVSGLNILDMLKDPSRPPDKMLPDTGVGIEWERILSSLFIKSDAYGTLSSSAILIKRTGEVTFWEQTHVPLQPELKEPGTFEFKLKLSPPFL
jgi:uncharacterized protein with NRDE domain